MAELLLRRLVVAPSLIAAITRVRRLVPRAAHEGALARQTMSGVTPNMPVDPPGYAEPV